MAVADGDRWGERAKMQDNDTTVIRSYVQQKQKRGKSV
jgi:hypothetical protein